MKERAEYIRLQEQTAEIIDALKDELKAYIESQGGKVTGSVTGKTSFLINNDINSTSGKNQKARQLSVPVISEDEFITRFG